VELSLQRVSALADLLTDGSVELAVSVGELEVLDHVSTSAVRRLVGYWVSEQAHPRETETAMLRLAVDWPARRQRAMRAAVLPLRANLDQDALELLRAFAAAALPRASPSAAMPPRGPLPGLAVDVRALKLKLDYWPKRVDVARLAEGDYFELLNVFALEGLEVSLRRVVLLAPASAAALEQVLESWARDVTGTQLHKVLAGVAPLGTAVSLGQGLSNLVLLPIDRLLDRPHRGPAPGKALHGILLDTLGVGSKVSGAAAQLLQGPRGQRVEQPRNAAEGLQFAAQSLSRGVKAASHTIVAVPLLNYQRDGTSGLVRAVIRAVPVAVLAPVAGVSEAVANLLTGVRNQMDPDLYADHLGKFKSDGPG
jgi:autophagy-related protein 2